MYQASMSCDNGRDMTRADDFHRHKPARRWAPPVSLRSLPLPTPALFGDRPPWSVVDAKEAASLIGVDPTTFNAWTYRSRGPLPLHESRRARSRAFRLSSIQQWLCREHGIMTTEEEIWRDFLRSAGFEDFVENADSAGLRAIIRICDPTAELD